MSIFKRGGRQEGLKNNGGPDDPSRRAFIRTATEALLGTSTAVIIADKLLNAIESDPNLNTVITELKQTIFPPKRYNSDRINELLQSCTGSPQKPSEVLRTEAVEYIETNLGLETEKFLGFIKPSRGIINDKQKSQANRILDSLRFLERNNGSLLKEEREKVEEVKEELEALEILKNIPEEKDKPKLNQILKLLKKKGIKIDDNMQYLFVALADSVDSPVHFVNALKHKNRNALEQHRNNMYAIDRENRWNKQGANDLSEAVPEASLKDVLYNRPSIEPIDREVREYEKKYLLRHLPQKHRWTSKIDKIIDAYDNNEWVRINHRYAIQKIAAEMYIRIRKNILDETAVNAVPTETSGVDPDARPRVSFHNTFSHYLGDDAIDVKLYRLTQVRVGNKIVVAMDHFDRYNQEMEKIKAIAINHGVIETHNEYKKPSSHSTGPHVHWTLKSVEERMALIGLSSEEDKV